MAEARCELPFSHTVPKTLGAVSITLWCPLRGGLPLCRLQHIATEGFRIGVGFAAHRFDIQSRGLYPQPLAVKT
jgi:hypothetical protein